MSRKPETESRRRARNSLSRKEIIDAGMEILEAEGGDSLTVRRLAKRLSCSSAALYSHFENVEALVNAMIRVSEKRLSRRLRQARLGAKHSVDQLSVIARAYWNYALENPELHRLLYRKTKSTMAPAYRVYMTTLRRGVRIGEVRLTHEEAAALGRTMFAWLYGLVTMELMGVMHVTGHGGRDLEAGMRHFYALLTSDPDTVLRKADWIPASPA